MDENKKKGGILLTQAHTIYSAYLPQYRGTTLAEPPLLAVLDDRTADLSTAKYDN